MELIYLRGQSHTHIGTHFWIRSGHWEDYSNKPISFVAWRLCRIECLLGHSAIRPMRRSPCGVRSFCRPILEKTCKSIRLCEACIYTHWKNRILYLPNMTTFSGSTAISLQKRSMPSGPNTSGSSVVVYFLNHVAQRFTLKVSSDFVVRLHFIIVKE